MKDSKKIYSINEIKLRLVPLFNEKGLQLVLLFGSMASGRATRQSDIDLAFLFDEPVDNLALTNRVIRLLQTDKVDVLDLRRTSPLLSFAGAKEGKLLYERTPGLFNSFCSLAFRRYIDTKKMRDAQGRAIEHFIEERELT
jgi:predicted nucleotidyltransferase